MSWKETCPMTERIRFVAELLEGQRDMSDLCRLYGISRKTGYKWQGRFEQGGPGGLEDRSHARHSQAHAVPEAVVKQVVRLRRRHGTWGPRKLLAELLRLEPEGPWPAASTIGEILQRHGLVQPRRRQRRSVPRETAGLSYPQDPNELWCTDFKGQFRTGDGRYCYPLTLSDAASRYVLECRGLAAPTAMLVRPWFERVFERYGLPWAIRSDNGPPFSSLAIAGLSELSIWWIKLGIMPQLIDPGQPQQNGRHERMHRTLKQETVRPVAAANLPAQQRRFDRFVAEFNTERPHEALGQRPPAAFYKASLRAYRQHEQALQYPGHYEVRNVRQNGEIKFNGELIYIGQVLGQEPIGMLEVDDDIWQVYFGPVKLGMLDTYRAKFYPVARKRKRNKQAQGAAPPAPPAKPDKVLPISPV